MIQRLRLILPIRPITLLAAFMVIAPFLLGTIWKACGLKPSDGQLLVAALVTIPTAFMYGVSRVANFHPYAKQAYKDWLARTPWTYGKPLPLGPLRLVWEDLLIIGCLAAIAVLAQIQVAPEVLARQSMLKTDPVGLVTMILAAFFCGHMLCLALTIGECERSVVAVLFIAPLIVYPHFNLWAGMVVLLVIYLIVIAAARRSLSQFPWNQPHWKLDSRQLLLDSVFRQGLIGSPYRDIGPPRTNKEPFVLQTTILVSTLIAWWTLALTHGGLLFTESSTGFSWQELTAAMSEYSDGARYYDALFWVCWVIVVLLIAGGRTLAYLHDTWPPISLLGRFATGRLIVPGYDKIFIAPIILLAYGWAGPNALLAIGLKPIVVPALSIFGLLVLSMTLGPSLESWRFTGHHRVRPWASPNKTTRRDNARSDRSIHINLTGPTR